MFVTPRTSVLTINHNMRRYLPSAIESVRRQKDQSLEHIIMDFASNDGSWEYLQQYRDRISVYRSESRLGLSESRNLILERACGKYISILDADDIFSSRKVAIHSAILDENPECAVVFGRALALKITTCTQTLGVIAPTNGGLGWDLTQDFKIVHSSMTFRRSALEALGGYRIGYEGNEDVDLFMRLGDHYQCEFHPSIACLVRQFMNNARRSADFGERMKESRKILTDTLKRRYGFLRDAL